jgi:hypothetical protein
LKLKLFIDCRNFNWTYMSQMYHVVVDIRFPGTQNLLHKLNNCEIIKEGHVHRSRFNLSVLINSCSHIYRYVSALVREVTWLTT